MGEGQWLSPAGAPAPSYTPLRISYQRGVLKLREGLTPAVEELVYFAEKSMILSDGITRSKHPENINRGHCPPVDGCLRKKSICANLFIGQPQEEKKPRGIILKRQMKTPSISYFIVWSAYYELPTLDTFLGVDVFNLTFAPDAT